MPQMISRRSAASLLLVALVLGACGGEAPSSSPHGAVAGVDGDAERQPCRLNPEKAAAVIGRELPERSSMTGVTCVLGASDPYTNITISESQNGITLADRRAEHDFLADDNAAGGSGTISRAEDLPELGAGAWIGYFDVEPPESAAVGVTANAGFDVDGSTYVLSVDNAADTPDRESVKALILRLHGEALER